MEGSIAAAYGPAHPSLPFGGIGNSGRGCRHGREGFLQFSYARSVFYSSSVKPGYVSPPYGEATAGIVETIFPWMK
jgi:coniferyl-aldehyde dehydrogenase